MYGEPMSALPQAGLLWTGKRTDFSQRGQFVCVPRMFCISIKLPKRCCPKEGRVLPCKVDPGAYAGLAKRTPGIDDYCKLWTDPHYVKLLRSGRLALENIATWSPAPPPPLESWGTTEPTATVYGPHRKRRTYNVEL